MKKALIVTARHPTPGRAKTRLAGALSVDQAAALYQCFLKDSLEIARSVTGATRYVAFTPADERDYFNCIAPDFGLFSQTGDGLGERLDNSLSRCLAEGFGGAVIVGSDCPTLPATYISCAFDLLEEADVALGPCDDGGYYLIGVKTPQPKLLREVRMSTPHVLEDTIALADSLGLKVALGPPHWDVDTVDDLRRLKAALASAPGHAAPHTRVYLRVIGAMLSGEQISL